MGREEVPGRGILTRTCWGVAVVAGAFSFLVFLFIVVSFTHSKRTDPLDSPLLETLREELKKDPEREALREEIRQLDLLARRAYFNSAAFRRTGSRLLLAGLVILLVCLKTLGTLSKKPADAVLPSRASPYEAAAMARWLVATLGAVMVFVFLLLLVYTPRPAPRPLPPAAPPPAGEWLGEKKEGLEARWRERVRQWPSFRGPDGGGRATFGGAPLAWNGQTGENILWKSPVPRPGFSSPILWGDRVFLTGGDEETREVYCFDADSGRLLWSHRAEGIPGSPGTLPSVTPDTGHAASTPATDGRLVFAVFSTGDLVALDFDGNRVWGMNLGLPENPYGHASSLLTWEDVLFVQYDHMLEARVIALDTSTGVVLWEQPRDLEVSWSSPILIEQEGAFQLVLNGNPFVVAYDPSTGAEQWRIECMSGELASSPAWAGGKVFVANEYARLAALSVGTAPSIAWEHFDDLPEVSSPLAAGGLLFMANGYGTVTCLDGETGALRWRQDFDEGFYASPVLVGDRVYLMDRSGVMRIFSAAAKYRLLGSPPLGEPSTATGAFMDGRIYLRGESHLFCVGGDGRGGER